MAPATDPQAEPRSTESALGRPRVAPNGRTLSSPADPGASLEEIVLARLREYASSLQGHAAKDMYALIMPQLERPLIRVAMELAQGRQRQAAAMLGIHRNTLRTRLKALGLEPDVGRQGRRPRRRR